MKTYSIISIVVLLSAMLQFVHASVSVPLSNTTIESNLNEGQMVRAVYKNGIYMPIVDLPEVEIIAFRNPIHFVKAKYNKGELIATIELPTVEISELRQKNQKTNSTFYFETITDIPVIEIVDELPTYNLVSGMLSEHDLIPVVDLPEIIIMVDNVESSWLSFIDKENNQSDLTFNSHPSVQLVIDQFINRNALLAEFNSFEIQNCMELGSQTVICEIVSESGEYASEKISTGILRLIFQK